MILRTIVDQQWLEGSNGGLWDVLECGHAEAYYGMRHKRRWCTTCPDVPDEQPELPSLPEQAPR